MTSFSWHHFEELPIVGILRGLEVEWLPGTVGAARRGGLRNIEITMNTPGAARQIEQALELAEGRMNVGAGTVTSLRLLDEALAAGASFIVTPHGQKDVVRSCVERGIPVFPGAFTPTEILGAWEAGAAMVKVFPAEQLGPGYIRALRGPFPDIKLLPTGGVSLETFASFIQAGANGFGIGSPLFDPARIRAQDWNWLEERCRAFRQLFKSTTNLSNSAR